MKSTARMEDGFVVLRIHPDDLHRVGVALAECPCRAVKSNATKDDREWLRGAILAAKATARKDKT